MPCARHAGVGVQSHRVRRAIFRCGMSWRSPLLAPRCKAWRSEPSRSTGSGGSSWVCPAACHHKSEENVKRYEQLAGQIEKLIRLGQLRAGARLPSVRIACRLYAASRTTVFRAYYKLESQGLIVAHARSGYFVSDTIHPERETLYE